MARKPARKFRTTRRASITIDGVRHRLMAMPIQPQWQAAAAAKGFDIVARARDRYHLVLRCRACGGLNLVKIYVLMNSQPRCRACLERDWRARAEAAGVTFLRRCPRARHYAWVRLACGHEVRRQMELIDRVGRGKTAIRCEICHAARERAEAEARGWRLVGPDPEGSPHYRLYAHDGPEGCGHRQRIARINMQTGRFGCAQCGESWSAAPSHIYLLAIELPPAESDGPWERVIKLGMSRDPVSRTRHQLPRHDAVRIEILDSVPMPRGRDALRIEKALHGRLARQAPQLRIPRARFENHLKVGSEIYHSALERPLRRAFDRLRAGVQPPTP
ncbi:hypothetical protein CCR87_08360 [Rhodobaculum claviforme]|uniref:Uncharacterized protein n=2 Tax=Rhodobaculum claviforme TaxID=1549854 RepID=A0A934TK76_9RHOB|nr:hypothetical protein [Rhodobaculum claviforme]